jgi:hypothetical protein
VTPLIPALKQLAALTPVNGTTSKYHLLAGILATEKNSKTLSMAMSILALKAVTNTIG